MMSAIQTVPVKPINSPRALLTLLNNRVRRPSIRNQDGTEIGEFPLLPSVINELTNRLITSIAETNP